MKEFQLIVLKQWGNMSFRDKISYKVYSNKSLENKINNIKKSYDNVYELIQKMKNKDNK